jgi:protein-disulfide isomerase
MRFFLSALAVLAVGLASGCSHHVAGTAAPDPHRPGVAVNDDGNGIVVGFPDAPVQLEIFTEPQCPGCARLQRKFGDALGYHLLSGRLAVTYRPETFIDGLGTEYSARVSNALFVAADSTASATAFQSYVMAVWEHQDAEGSPGPSDRELARWARASGIPDKAAQRIADGEPGVDVDAMSEANIDELADVCAPDDPATPTVYDVNDDKVIDTSDDDWLNKLITKL